MMKAHGPETIENRKSRIANLFVDPPHDGVTNMAIDGCLLEEVQAGGGGALRFYRWEPATLSLGYFQRFDDPAVVRRCTGGGAILHADELTYSLSLPMDHPLTGERPEDLYAWMHARIAEAVAALGGRTAPKGGGDESDLRHGPFLCFERHAGFDLMAGDGGTMKLVGSAQRRTKRGLLQHGSVVLARTHPIQPSGSVSEVVGRPVGFDEMADAIARAVAAAGVTLGAPRTSQTDADMLDRQRTIHAGDEWRRRR